MSSMNRRRRSGAEPMTARSALRTRTAFATVGLIVGVALAVACAFWGERSPGGGAAAWTLVALGVVVAIISAADLWVLRRRR
ncbi:hypothetical protein GCM10009678_36460 [Actinomadura kijaniata]|uniref:Multisubunit Na+/H+ antiporter MnhB subunit n=1 Tax=Actinomadura namibiensis TaxID=182080 RepID=A0A7W3QM46_ACTNM|nr:DUF6343 family protein [Actinomadura namibiensis]MBA8952180.1 multisubunit Na+/H+ antiporter MnhB subunit [Actinomadura namibiensis]